MFNWLKSFPISKSSLAATVVGLLFVFSASGQSTGDTLRSDNVVIFDSPDYLIFRWQGDTLDTYWLSDFFLYMERTKDSLQANAMEHSIVVFLRQQPTAVQTLNVFLNETVFLSLDEYACFLRLQERRWRIIKE